MEGNDIGSWAVSHQGVVFEGVLASQPHRRMPAFRNSLLAGRATNWESFIANWKANDIPLKSMINCVNRLGIKTSVYTFLAEEAVDPIERWLARKGVASTCLFYSSPKLLAQDLIYDRSVHTVYVPTVELARELGLRATVVGPDTHWSM